MRKFLCIFALVATCAPFAQAQDINTIQMGTPTCVTYPEWTGQDVNTLDLSIIGDRPHRILKPDSMMTMDYLPDRLNIKTDEVGIIITTDCG